jgi:hypothetical protein
MPTSNMVSFLAGAFVAMMSAAATHSLDARAAARPITRGTHVNLAPEDYIEILQLTNHYTRDVDPGAVRDASWMFTKDARTSLSTLAPFVKPADYKYHFSAIVGPSGQAARGGSRHFNTSPVIIGLPDGTARGSSYMLSVSIKKKGDTPTIDGMGKYEDLYVKTPEGGRIKERSWTPDAYVGSYQDVAPSPVLTDPSTWTTRTEAQIQELWAKGLTRDAQGVPVAAAQP